MKTYLAARYERRDELCSYIDALAMVGIDVVSSWLWIVHTDLHEAAVSDLADLRRADQLIFFSEDITSSWPRGSRCVEYGIALALGKKIVVIGPRENVFHWLLPNSAFFESVDALCRHHTKE